VSARRIGLLIRRWWWLVLTPAVLLTALVAASATQRSPEYVAEGSYVVRVSVDEADDLVRATAALSETDEIASTYASVARSGRIAELARARLGLAPGEGADVMVTSSVVPDANVVVIGARSSDPQLALDMATAAGELTEQYVGQDASTFVLAELDPARLPAAPADRPVSTFIAGAAVAGLALGLGLAVVAERARPSGAPRPRLRGVFDDQSATYTKPYFEMRLAQEVARSRRTHRTFSVGVLQVLRRRPDGVEAEDPARLTEAELAAVSTGISRTLRDHDILGHLGRGRFAAILPDMPLAEARELVQGWRRLPAGVLSRDRRGRDFTVTVCACEYEPSGFVGDPDAERIVSHL
jgi:capsular polysaccharide biosynthesis protein/GGDEF domain-containing protein